MKKYLIIGCARSGISVAEFLIKKGEKIILTDTKSEEEIIKLFPSILELKKQTNIEFIFGKQPPEDILENIKEIILSPGVPPHIPIVKKAEELDINIIGEIELAYRFSNAPIVAITGTNGKTTTTTLVGEIFKNSGKKTFVVGNIGDPLINYVDEAKEEDVFVVEISSFQLETIEYFRPKIGTILNITPDHLDRHGTLENYINAKYRLVENMTSEDIFLTNADDRELNKRIPSNTKVISFSVKNEVEEGAYLEGNSLYVKKDGHKHLICYKDELKIPGIHNIQNILAAAAIAFYSGISIDTIHKTITNFKGVEHRLEFVKNIDGINFINDSKGTNTDASITAIRAFDGPIVLIAGGYDKKVSYDEWVDAFNDKVKYLVVMGQTADIMMKTALDKGFKEVIKVDDFKEAVLEAYAKAEPGDTVLLSPACASWGMFKDFEERGRIFKEIVANIGGK